MNEMMDSHPALIQLRSTDPMPSVDMAWGHDSMAPGLLAIGGGLSVERLIEAYSQACFPWYSDGQPVMWWSTDPRMVLAVNEFRLHKSLRKHLKQLISTNKLEIRVNHDFSKIIQYCSHTSRKDQSGTWIVKDMIQEYENLHKAGFAHSIETWINGELQGGLYLVSIGKAVFGESMFALQSNASKVALAALICICKVEQIPLIDCQQNTPHLASLGAKPIPRQAFLNHLGEVKNAAHVTWKFDPIYWSELMVEPQQT